MDPLYYQGGRKGSFMSRDLRPNSNIHASTMKLVASRKKYLIRAMYQEANSKNTEGRIKMLEGESRMHGDRTRTALVRGDH